MSRKPPSTHGPNGSGRDPESGRFTPGWKGGKGNPLAGKVAKLRSALIEAVGTSDLAAVIRALIRKAKKGDVAAARELLDRTIGKPLELDLIQRLEELEAQAGEEGGAAA